MADPKEVGRRFIGYLQSLPGTRDETGGLLGSIPEPFYSDIGQQLSELDLAKQKAGANRLDRIMDLTEKFFQEALDRHPDREPKTLMLGALERAIQQVKEEIKCQTK